MFVLFLFQSFQSCQSVAEVIAETFFSLEFVLQMFGITLLSESCLVFCHLRSLCCST